MKTIIDGVLVDKCSRCTTLWTVANRQLTAKIERQKMELRRLSGAEDKTSQAVAAQLRAEAKLVAWANADQARLRLVEAERDRLKAELDALKARG